MALVLMAASNSALSTSLSSVARFSPLGCGPSFGGAVVVFSWL